MKKVTWKEFIADAKKGLFLVGAPGKQSVSMEDLVKKLDKLAEANKDYDTETSHVLQKVGSTALIFKRDHGGTSRLDKKGKIFKHENKYATFYIVDTGDGAGHSYVIYEVTGKGFGTAVSTAGEEFKLSPKEEKHINMILNMIYKDKAEEVKKKLIDKGLFEQFIRGINHYAEEYKDKWSIDNLFKVLEKDKKILEQYGKKRRTYKEPLVGDWVILDGKRVRIANIVDNKGNFVYKFQPSEGGSFALGSNGKASFSGTLGDPVTGELIPTRKLNKAEFWIFSEGRAGAGRGVHGDVYVQVWKFKPLKVIK